MFFEGVSILVYNVGGNFYGSSIIFINFILEVDGDPEEVKNGIIFILI